MNVGPRYTLYEKIGKGAMGDIFRAFDHLRDHTVALKSLRTPEPEQITNLKREFRLAADLRHPNLVRIYDLTILPDHCFFTMELVEGQTLLQDITSTQDSDETPLPSSRCDFDRLAIVLPSILAGLEHLHLAGKVHRDIKPQNIVVTSDGTAKLLDFGIVQEKPDERREAIGTPQYMSPEQAMGRFVDAAADLYSLGCVLFLAISGRLPFLSKTGRGFLEAHVRQVPPKLSEVCQGFPEPYEAIVDALLQKNPRHRPTLRDLWARLARELGMRTPLPQSAKPWRESSFVGREDEQEILREAARDVASGEARWVQLEGEFGIGKSHLITTVLDSLEEEGWRCYRARCYEREDIPYKAFDLIAEGVASTLRRKEGEDQDALLPSMHWKPLCQMFPSMRRVPRLAALAEKESDELAPTEARSAAFGAWRTILQKLRMLRPLTLVIEDIQCADTESLALIQSMCSGEDAPPLLLLSTARYTTPALLESLHTTHAQRLRLSPFRPEELKLLLEEHRGEEVADEEVQALFEESGGNPFLARELIAGDTQKTLKKRLESLDETSRELVSLLAVAETSLSLSVLRAASRHPSAIFSEGIDFLLYEHIISESMLHLGEPSYEIFFEPLQELLVQEISAAERTRLHRSLAQALMANQNPLEQVAEHWLRGEMPDRAAHCWKEAAREAERKLAFDHAASLYAKAIPLLPQAEQVALFEARGRSLELLGRAHEASLLYAEAAARADVSAKPRLTVLSATAELKSGLLQEGLARFEEVFRSIEGRDATLLRTPTRVLTSLGYHLAKARLRYLLPLAENQPSPELRLKLDLYRRLGSYLTMLDRLRGGEFQARFLDLALHSGAREDVVYALYLITAFFSLREGEGPLASARQALDQADTHAKNITDTEILAFGETSRGLLLWKSADWENARTAFAKADELLRKTGHGDTLERTLAELFLAATDGNLGDLVGCEARLSASMKRAEARVDCFAQALLAAPLAEYRLLLGRPEEAQEALSHGEIWPNNPPSYPLLLVACAKARWLLYQGRAIEANELLERLQHAEKDNGLRYVSGKQTEVSLLRATALLSLAMHGVSVEANRKQALRELKKPLSQPPKTFHATALRLRAIAQPENAEEDLTRAIEILRLCRSPIDLAAALLQRSTLGERFAEDRREGEELLARCHASDPAKREGFAWRWSPTT